MEVNFTDKCLEKIKRHSMRGYPSEVCGFLVGEKEGWRVEEVIDSKNVANSKMLFEIGSKKILEVLEKVEESGFKLLGFYHSHPTGSANISERDLKFMKLWPEKLWVILGVNQSGVKEISTYIDEEEVEEVGIEKNSTF
ncbi:metalloprotease [archaeon SCG-AAA382B04]|nr:metalloprotease [archaeon SCG-AAA382B04]